MKTVFTAVFQDEAIVLKSLLESAGIEAQLMVDKMLDVNPYFVMDVKGVKVIVPDGQEADALAIVADFRAHRHAGEEK